jgi:diguanylate cyclase (GGDEF)-like protein
MPPDSLSKTRELSEIVALEERTRVQLLRTLLRTFVVLTAAIALIGVGVGASGYRQAALAASGAGVYGLLLALLPRLGPRRTGALCTIWYFTIAVTAMGVGRGVHDVSMVLIPAGLIVGSLLMPRRWLAPLIGFTIAAVAAVGAAQALRSPSQQTAGALAEVAVSVLLLLVAAVLTLQIVSSLRTALIERREAEHALVASRDELAARNEALQAVNDLANRLHRSLEIGEIARQAVVVLTNIRFNRAPHQVACYLLDEDGSQLRLVADQGFPEELRHLGATLPLDGSLSGRAMREHRVITTEDIANDRRVYAPIGEALTAMGAAAGAAVPVEFGDAALGTINLVFNERPTLTPVELDTLKAIGQTVALAVSNARHLASLEHQAYHDSLTGLPNRASLHRDLGALARHGESPASAGLVLLNLNRFREINDALGHDVGDLLLAEIGARLGRLEEPRARFYRLGGDDFAALLPEVTGPGDAAQLARQLLAELARPLDAAGAALEVGAAAGVAIYPDHGGSSHELLRCADVALYRSKRAGTAITTYAPEYDEHTPERLTLVSELGHAVREGRLILHFQPTVALASGVAVGFEALVRWPHPRLGLLSAAEFLPLAEASDLIHPLTYWVVESALTQLCRWQVERRDLTMAINLSVRNLLDSNCSRRMEEIIRRVGVDPGTVAFELTETAVMIDPEDAVTMLGRITATGVHLAIDDFGTGYSSFTYLRRFPVHAIKIDRSFVADMDHQGERSLAIVRSTVQLARGLGLQTIAEGVERPETVRALREVECDMAQGYFFARPGPADEIELLLRSSHWTLPAVAST